MDRLVNQLQQLGNQLEQMGNRMDRTCNSVNALVKIQWTGVQVNPPESSEKASLEYKSHADAKPDIDHRLTSLETQIQSLVHRIQALERQTIIPSSLAMAQVAPLAQGIEDEDDDGIEDEPDEVLWDFIDPADRQ